jgi:hypothetical protein
VSAALSSLPLLLVVLAAPTATLSRQHFERARRWFAQHDYRRALDEFTAAAESAPTELPDLWFDIGQCHRNLGHNRQAVLAFDRYLALATDAGDRAKVQALVTQIGGRPVAAPAEPAPPVAAVEPAAASPAEPATPPTATPATTPPLAAAPVAAPAALLASDTPSAPAPVRPRRRWMVWTAVAGGVAVTAVALGLGLGLTLDHGAAAASPTGGAPLPMLGSAGTFDTRGR